MASAINPALPADAPALANKADVRANFAAAKTEIEALQGGAGASLVIDAAATYGVVANGSTNNATALETMRAALAGPGKPHYNIVLPTGLLLYDVNKWLTNIESCDVWGYGTTLRCTRAAGDSRLTPVLRNGEMFVTNNLAYTGGITVAPMYLFNSASANSPTITTTTAADAGNFTAGDRVFIHGFDTQFSGYPPNVRFFEWHTVVSAVAGTGVVTLEKRLRYSYSSSWYDSPNFLATGVGIGKPRILRLSRADYVYPRYLGLHGIRLANNLNDTVNTGFVLAAEYMLWEDVIHDGQLWPSQTKTSLYRRCRILDASDIDKICDLVRFEQCEIGDDGIGSATGVNKLEIIDTHISGHVQAAPRRMLISGGSIAANGANAGIAPYAGQNSSRLWEFKDIRFTRRASATNVGYFTGSAPLTFTVDAVTGTSIKLDDDATGKQVVCSLDVGTFLMKLDGSKSGYVTAITFDGTRHVIDGTWVAPVAAESWVYEPVMKVVDHGGHSREDTTIPLYDQSMAKWANNKASAIGQLNRAILTQDDFQWNGTQPTLQIPINGFVREVVVDIRKPYTGSDATAHFAVLRANNFASINEVNAKTVGIRIVTPNRSEGLQTGDTLAPSEITAWIEKVYLYHGGSGLTDKGADDLPQLQCEIAWVRGSSG